MTDVSRVIYPNRVLRQAGLLTTQEQDGAEYVDMAQSRAFAMVDHQFAHVYCVDADATARCDELFRDLPGLAGAWSGGRRRDIGMDHERSGDVVLIAGDDAWLAYYWWLDDAAAPPFARTVDIHRKPGYDPVELFFDPATRSIPLDAKLVKGSHGVPATQAQHRTALICSQASSVVASGQRYRDTDIKRIMLELLRM